jgi:hypothetical protein
MSIVIKPIVQGEQYEVNSAEFFLKGDTWISSTEPTMKELTAFHLYKKAQINNPDIKHHTRAVYNG